MIITFTGHDDAVIQYQAYRRHDLFIRDVSDLNHRFNDIAIRIAVKARATNLRMIEILSKVLGRTHF